MAAIAQTSGQPIPPQPGNVAGTPVVQYDNYPAGRQNGVSTANYTIPAYYTSPTGELRAGQPSPHLF